MKQSIWMLILVLIFTVQPLLSLAQDTNCPGAPTPQLVVGQQGQVAPGSANNMRDQPNTGGGRVGAIEPGEIFTVLEGPVCADGFNWWRVDYNGVVGWTVEGQGEDYWVVPVIAAAESDTPTPALTPVNTPVPAVDVVYAPPLPIDNVLAIGTQVRVNTSGDQLRVRAEPGTGGAVVTQLSDGEIVTVTDGAREADGYRWWQIETADGQTGWTIDGVVENDYRDRPVFVQTLVPLCPYTTDRLAFVIDGHIYTADTDGSHVCHLTPLFGPSVHTFWSYFFYMPNSTHWSPDGSEILYITWPVMEARNYDLYAISADGGTVRRLTTDSDVLWADWSPDGSRIAIARTLEGQTYPQIWVMNADGSRPAALSQANIFHPWVEWLDNDRVVYVEQSQRLVQVYREITYTFHVVGADGSSPRLLWTTTLDVRRVRVSPDGARLAVSGFNWVDSEPTTAQIVVLDVATGDVILTYEGSTQFLWSPSGLLIVMAGEQLVLIEPDGAETRLDMALPFLGTSDDRAWSDDAQRFYGTDDEVIRTIDVFNGTFTPILNTNGFTSAVSVQPASE